jgi:UDP-N-acetylglucosamine--N-acetylmuramyl-(pentapeptide) pyrophosphoryl-undecaprenol N-acetylglucosamine transferase
MAALLHRADLVISRAGAGTLTELAVTHTPSLLIPYPFAADDHQTFNARVFSRAGAALLLDQRDLSPQNLEEQVLKLLRSPQSLAQMGAAAASLAVKDSAQMLTTLVRQAIEEIGDR